MPFLLLLLLSCDCSSLGSKLFSVVRVLLYISLYNIKKKEMVGPKNKTFTMSLWLSRDNSRSEVNQIPAFIGFTRYSPWVGLSIRPVS